MMIGKAIELQKKKTSTSASLITLKPLTVWITRKCRKFFKEMGIPGYLICLLRNLYAGQEAKVRTGHGTMDWFSPVLNWEGSMSRLHIVTMLINLYAEYIMWNAGLDEA